MAHFFERQETAQARTTQLIVIYSATVLLLILGLYATVLLLLGYGVGPSIFESGSSLEAARAAAYGDESIALVRPWILLGVAGVVGGFLWMARGLQLRKLRAGGHVVAQRLHGTKLDPAQAMGGRRQLVHVVEEMAVAAGVSAPPVYILEEKGINAFSAGFTPDDAVIGVTRAAIDRLNRNELQGVVAHEFSHILNGDMGLNLRLLGWTHGIRLFSETGRGLLKVLIGFPVKLLVGTGKMVKSYFGILSKMGKKAEGGVGSVLFYLLAAVVVFFFSGVILAPIMYLAVPLLVSAAAFLLPILGTPIGRGALVLAASVAVLGGLCALGARLLKARVSREREGLADAAAMQFTRNPEGIGGALLKLRDCAYGGAVQAGYAGAFRHLFFGDPTSLGTMLPNWGPGDGAPFNGLATHPPIEERLRGIDPSLLERSASTGDGSLADAESDSPVNEDPDPALSPEDLIKRAGTLSPEMLAQAHALHDSIPKGLLDAVHQPLGAVAVCYALMLDTDPEMRSHQMDLLWEQETPPVFEETKRLANRVATLDQSLRLPVVEVAAPSLRDLSAEQRERLRETIRVLAEADDRLTIFEFALQTIVRHYLDRLNRSDGRAKDTTPADEQGEIAVLLSGLAQAGHETEDEARAAVETAYGPLAEAYNIGPADLAFPSPDAIGSALDRLARTPLSFRQELLQACAQCAMADERITRTEEDLLRAVAVAIGVPLPASLSKETGPDSHRDVQLPA